MKQALVCVSKNKQRLETHYYGNALLVFCLKLFSVALLICVWKLLKVYNTYLYREIVVIFAMSIKWEPYALVNHNKTFSHIPRTSPRKKENYSLNKKSIYLCLQEAKYLVFIVRLLAIVVGTLIIHRLSFQKNLLWELLLPHCIVNLHRQRCHFS